MQTTFEKLFHLDFKHSYLNSNNPESDIKLGPRILNGSSDIRLKETGNAYFAYRQVIPRTINDSPEYLSLYFPISFSDPNFVNYTEINLSPSTVLYFSSDQATDGIIQSKDAINITLQPSRFNYPMDLTSLNNLISISLTHPNGDIQELPPPTASNQNGYPVNLSGEIAGKYELRFHFISEKENIKYTFFASDLFYNSPPQAIFECKLNIDPSESDINTPTFTISFENRSTYWRYVFPNLENEERKTLKIDSIEINNQTISFQETKQPFQLPTGQSASALISSKPIPLMERPPWEFKLTSKKIPDGITLPYPQINSLSIKPSEGESSKKDPEIFISDVFVYL